MNDFWTESKDLPGEIFDMTDEAINQFLDEEENHQEFDMDDYLTGNYDY